VGVKKSDQLELYVDGRFNSSSGHSLGTVSNNEPLHFGSFSAPITWFYQGALDDVRIWSEARTEHQILEEYFSRLTGAEPNLAGHWRFDEGEGQSAGDEASTNDGRFGSTAAADPNDPLWLSAKFPLIFMRDGFEMLPPQE